ncbi:hypothetical protein pb186bvf_001574 [Paramecium bursaria]
MYVNKRFGKRAASVQDSKDQHQVKGQLPTILTPTFGDWKMMHNDLKSHPKVTRRNPLFNKFGLFPQKQPITPSNMRALRSEEQSYRVFREFEDRMSTNETNERLLSRSPQTRAKSVREQDRGQLLTECKQLFDNQKKVFEDILRQNDLYTKYCKQIKRQFRYLTNTNEILYFFLFLQKKIQKNKYLNIQQMLSTASGFQSMLKEGARHYSGLEEAILKNIQACKDISNMTKTSLGPNGMKKMVINHIDKIFVTSDAATILKEMEIQHPAAKMVLMAAKMQEQEYGDATNLVITLAGEFLSQAESLIKMGLHPSQIVTGYESALTKTLEILETLTAWKVTDFTDQAQVQKALRTSLSAKLADHTDLITKLVAKACIKSLPKDPNDFDQEFVRVSKIIGGSVHDSRTVNGLIVNRNVEGTITRVDNPRIAIYNAPLDPQSAETKGTVLIKNAAELLNYTKSEEDLAQKLVQSIADTGVTLIVAGGSISELILHFIEKYKIMVLKVTSKFELKRLCKAVGASAVARLAAPLPDEIGTCDRVHVQEIGSHKVTIFERESDVCKLSTIVLRGATQNHLDDIERAIDDGVNLYRSLVKDQRFVYGGGSTEIRLAQLLENEANKIKSLDQYAYRQYAQSFEIIPRILVENAGLNQNEVLAKLHKLNSEKPHTINVYKGGELVPSESVDVFDHLKTKIQAIKLATDAAVTILRVDQIIIAKPAGGPKMPQKQGWDNDD